MTDLNEVPDVETKTNPARHAKKIALKHFEQALAADEKHFRMELIDDGTVEVTDVLSGNRRIVNVELDNVPAMILDILKQAGDWIL